MQLLRAAFIPLVSYGTCRADVGCSLLAFSCRPSPQNQMTHFKTYIASISLLLATSAHAETVRVGYVSGGLYEQFVMQKMVGIELGETEFEFVETQGSRDQMERLSASEIDLAIVQSDIAYYVHTGIRGYEGFSDFALVLPLFEEYVQVIVSADSGIYTLGRLLSGTVSVGERGSGTFQNAMDLFDHLGFRAGIDFEMKHLPTQDALRTLRTQEIDGAIFTGGVFPLNGSLSPDEFRVLDIPETVLETLAIESPYYTKTRFTQPNSANTGMVNTVSVVALLVASNDLDVDVVTDIIRSVTGNGTFFQTSDGSQVSLKSPASAIERSAIPLHDGLRQHLIREGHLGRDYSIFLVFVVVFALIGFVTTVQLRMRTYDRMGNLTASKGTITHTFYELISKSGAGLIVLFIFFLLVVGFVEAIQFFEADHARKLNIRNQFADRGFLNSLLWVITFMGAGDPGDMFPNSDAGKFLASLLPFLGIGAVLGFGYSALEKRRENRMRASEGTLIHSVRDHVLVCGWNKKAPGIIYTLTSSDVPRKRHVIVIADMDERTPLAQYNFDLRYVSYCKGDSADHKVLERANASFADVAVILGGVKKRAGRNIKSVLSALALRELSAKNNARQDDIMVVAELMFSENEDLFRTCGADAIVSSEAIADRVATMSCVSPLLVDFVLDMLTYDERSELYALPMDELSSVIDLQQEEAITLQEVATALLPLGVNVIATNNTRYEDPAFLDHIFTGEKFKLRLTDSETVLDDDHELLIIVDDYKKVKKLAKSKRLTTGRGLNSKLSLQGPVSKRLILVGHQDRCIKISEGLSHFSLMNTIIIATNEDAVERSGVIAGDFTDEAVWQRAGLAKADQITVLAKTHESKNVRTNYDVNELDAHALLIAKFASTYSAKLCQEKTPVIVAEMLSASNQQLFTDAGVEITIPADRMLERVISKLIYSRGAATRFLMALMRLDDGKHFITFELKDPRSCRSFEDLVISMPEYFQLLGVLPREGPEREKWRNTVGDFQYHFLTTSTQDNAREYVPHTNDILVGIVDQAKWMETYTETDQPD